jgi:hypothetical protein
MARLHNGDRLSDEPPDARASLFWNSAADHRFRTPASECLDGHTPAERAAVDDAEPTDQSSSERTMP